MEACGIEVFGRCVGLEDTFQVNFGVIEIGVIWIPPCPVDPGCACSRLEVQNAGRGGGI